MAWSSGCELWTRSKNVCLNDDEVYLNFILERECIHSLASQLFERVSEPKLRIVAGSAVFDLLLPQAHDFCMMVLEFGKSQSL